MPDLSSRVATSPRALGYNLIDRADFGSCLWDDPFSAQGHGDHRFSASIRMLCGGTDARRLHKERIGSTGKDAKTPSSRIQACRLKAIGAACSATTAGCSANSRADACSAAAGDV